jgi:DNA-binding MarR family transcriptional regulator
VAIDAQLTFADHVARYLARTQGFPPVAGRVLGYLGVCEPAAQSIGDLSDALLASRSAITQAVVLLESRGLVQRSRVRGDRVDRVTARLDASTVERDFDPTAFAETAALLRRGAALLADEASDRRQALEEFAALHDFLAAKFPLLKKEWLARRARMRGTGARRIRVRRATRKETR